MVNTAKTKKPTKAEQDKMLRDYLAQILSSIAPGVEIGKTSMDIALQIDNATTIIPKLEKKLAEYDKGIQGVVEENLALKQEVSDVHRQNYVFRCTGFDAEVDALAICDQALSELLPLDPDDQTGPGQFGYAHRQDSSYAARQRVVEFLIAKYTAINNRR